MNIAMISRSTLYSSPGGDTVQLEKTASELRKLGINVDIFLSKEKIDYQKYDLLHFFNLIRPADILKHIKGNVPYLISTIYVDYSEYEKRESRGIRRLIANLVTSDFLEYIKVVARMILGREKIQDIRYILLGHRYCVKYALKKAAAILPNSISEQHRVEKKYKIVRPSYVVYNGIETHKFKKAKADPKYKDAIICVGRIEGRKNQLRLINAMEGLPYQLYVIGKESPNDKAYADLCKKAAAPNVHFINHLPQEKLFDIMKAAKVHVLPSFFETCGLVSLEAAYLDCSIVVTNKGDQEEYFKENGLYCNPYSVSSIKEAIVKAYNADSSLELKKRISQTFTWEKAALSTLAAYKAVLSKSDLLTENN